jgi:hypothetical protein
MLLECLVLCSDFLILFPEFLSLHCVMLARYVDFQTTTKIGAILAHEVQSTLIMTIR